MIGFWESKLNTVMVLCSTSVRQHLPVPLAFSGLFPVSGPWGILCMTLMTCILCSFAPERLCMTALWVNPTHTHTKKGLGRGVMKGCAYRQRKQQLLLGGSSHTGGWRKEKGGSSRLWFSWAPSPDWSPQTSITQTHQQTSALQFFSVLSVNQGRILGSFITIFSWVTVWERWNSWHAVFQSDIPQFFHCCWAKHTKLSVQTE